MTQHSRMSVLTAVTLYLHVSAVNQTLTTLTIHASMTSTLKRYIAVASSMMLVLATLIGIPTREYIKQIAASQDCVPSGIAFGVPNFWNKHMSKTYAYGLIKLDYPKWGRGEWIALTKLWGKESAWNHEAQNPHSSAYGIAQVLNTKPGTPAPLQIERGLSYIEHRYDKPSIAWAHWRKHGWY